MTQPVQIRLARRPEGPADASTWSITHDEGRAPGEGEIRLAVTHISLDPAMRGWISDARSYMPPVGIGDVMRAIGIGEVTATASDRFRIGDMVMGLTGVQTDATVLARDFNRIEPSLAPPETFLGGLGMPGLTAYFGLLDLGKPEPGQTVVVSAAAGAVGGVVGQIAKIKGCRVVGLAGGPDKCRYVVEELGFDACIDYRAGALHEQLKAACPDRIDVYFDNVGGEILEACLGLLAQRARVVICGAISQYNSTEGMRGPANYMSLLVNRARMEGFMVFDYQKQFPAAVMEMAGWVAAGKLRFREHVVEGIECFPTAFNMLFTGQNFGKLVIRV
ncbi:MAG: NADP-dependent oxidoreductase [Caulobacteraceae bacterium]|nr:NADP-dependent oxidoreductase [Caulobacteraceae bacterium]